MDASPNVNMATPMRHNPRLAGGVPLGLHAGIGELQILNALHLDVQPGERLAHHVRRIRTTGELLTATRIEAVLAQESGKFALANFAFGSGVHFSFQFSAFPRPL